MSTNANQNIELVNGVKRLENEAWNVILIDPATQGRQVMSQQGIDRWKFVSPKDNKTGYFLLEARQVGAMWGEKERIVTIFEKQYESEKDTWLMKGLRRFMEQNQIDSEGIVEPTLKGQWYDIPLLEPINWHPANSKKPVIKTTQGQFLAAGEDLGATITRIQQRFIKLANDPNNKDYSVIVKETPEQAEAKAQALAEAEGQV